MPVYRVRVELKRIQTYLFAVPRLRTILGANALIGETLRQRLAEAARDDKAGRVAKACLPPEVVLPASLDQSACNLVTTPAAGLAEPWASWSADDPKESYDKGILTRDGGHFQALFSRDTGDTDASNFVDEARRIVGEHLPGVMVSVQVDRWDSGSGSTFAADVEGAWKTVQREGADSLQQLFETPGERTCEWSGQGPGVLSLDNAGSKVWVSPLVKGQWDAGTRFRNGRTFDIVGLLQKVKKADGTHVLPCRGQGWADAEDLTELAGGKGRYLALVHVDGNGVGKRKPQTQRNTGNATLTLQDWLDQEAKVEAFFASMRQNVRLALVEALEKTFGEIKASLHISPYQLLMLGGDDLLLACQAEYALPFVQHYAESLKGKNLSDGKPLDIGAGVAIAQPTFPFHALNALAEELASSAKRLSRACEGHSVVDWMVVSNASVPDPAEHRRLHDWVRYRLSAAGQTEQLALNARPYFVLPDAERTHSIDKPSLQELQAAADALRSARAGKGGEVARSQLKQLPADLRAGRRSGDHAFRVLPEAVRQTLKSHGISQAWTPIVRPDAQAGARPEAWYTPLVDLVEVSEIPGLGRRIAESPDEQSAATKAAGTDAVFVETAP